ncbi:unnamed protein product [Cuscuta campestris]|uniref:Uncharacterized protein n=1 Tax=Cuscuta campestris TaxID=132261 RepID=A0A484NET4_9ASTE|nr:unnamed protein product [Cuscuta campestris]
MFVSSSSSGQPGAAAAAESTAELRRRQPPFLRPSSRSRHRRTRAAATSLPSNSSSIPSISSGPQDEVLDPEFATHAAECVVLFMEMLKCLYSLENFDGNWPPSIPRRI